MKILFAPGIALCVRLKHGQKYLLSFVLLLLPTLCPGYRLIGGSLPLPLSAAAFVSALAALYLLAAQALAQKQTADGFFAAITRFAQGDSPLASD